MLLVVGNRNYSSWSIRPWFFLVEAGIPFELETLALDEPDFAPRVSARSPSKRVPALVLAEGDVVWDSLAMGEYFAEAFPEAGVWPSDPRHRRLTRSAAAEMHSGFSEMRRVLTCNQRKRYAPEGWKTVAGGDEAVNAVLADVTRVHELWDTLLQASGGPFLGGGFGFVDAYFAPVVSRFATYGIPSPPESAAYRAQLEALPAWKRWSDEARGEPFVIAKYEYAIPLAP